MAAVVCLVGSTKSESKKLAVEFASETPAYKGMESVPMCWMTPMMVTNQSDSCFHLENHIRRWVAMFAQEEVGEGEEEEKKAQRKHQTQTPKKRGQQKATQEKNQGRKETEQTQGKEEPKNPEEGQDKRGEGEGKSSCQSDQCYRLQVSTEQPCLPIQKHNTGSATVPAEVFAIVPCNACDAC
jgi:hypothetical protein